MRTLDLQANSTLSHSATSNPILLEEAGATSGAARRPALAGADPPPDLLFTFLPLRADDGGQSLAALVERVSGPSAAGAGQSATVRHGHAFIRL